MLHILFDILRKRPKNRICVTTYYDDFFSAIGDLSCQSIQRYANLHGWDAVVLKDIESARPLSWHKILVIKQLFLREYDYVFWIDADAIIVDYDKNIEKELVDDKALYLVKHMINSKEVPNLGVFVIKNCKWSNEFLDLCWAKHEYINHKWWENAAVLDMIGYYSLLNEALPDKINYDMLTRIKWLDRKWNSLPGICESEHAIINHYASRPFEYRLKHMKQDMQKHHIR